jgi:hypothetical protein
VTRESTVGHGTDGWGLRGLPLGVDASHPHPARIYDHWLGGKDSFAVDREVANRVAELAPWAVAGARANRAFLRRAVAYLARHSIRQFLDCADIGAGLPSAGNVHEIATRHAPNARVVYVDNDPSNSGCVHTGIS